MQKLIHSALALGLIFLAFSVRAELPADYKVMLITENFPPFNMSLHDENFTREARIDGISTYVVKEMFRRASLKYSLSMRFPWNFLYRLAQEKPNYGLFSTALTAERKPLFKWVGPLAKTEWVLLAAPGSKINLKDVKSAAQYRIGAYNGGVVGEYLEKQGMTPHNTLLDQDNVKKLLKKKIDLWATTEPGGSYQAKLQGVNNLETILRFNSADLYLAFNKDTPDEVIERLQKALDQMRGEGYVDKIMKGYLL